MGCCSGKAPPEFDPLLHPVDFSSAAPITNGGASSSSARAEVHDQNEVCGFKTIPELPSIEVADASVAEYTLPTEALCYTPAPDVVVTVFPNGDMERKIHCNTPLSKVEQRQVKGLQAFADKEGAAFFPSVAAAATRYLGHTKGDIRKALSRMLATQKWRTEYFAEGPIRESTVGEDLQSGILYIVGRDYAMHPTIVCRPIRMPSAWFEDGTATQRLLRCAVFCMEYILKYMCIPGRVESICMIFDMEGMSATQVPITPIKEIYSIFHNHYPGRAFRFNVCNLSPAMGFVLAIARSVMTERQRQKLAVIGDWSELLDLWAPHQLEEEFGGTRPSLDKFFPFPIQAGPYEVGGNSGPDSGSAKNLHRAFKPDGLRGQFWDSTRSIKENTVLGYSEQAVQLFKQYGLPAPGEVPTKDEACNGDSSTPSTASMSSQPVPKTSSFKKSARGQCGGCFAFGSRRKPSRRSVSWHSDDVVVTAKGDQVLRQSRSAHFA